MREIFGLTSVKHQALFSKFRKLKDVPWSIYTTAADKKEGIVFYLSLSDFLNHYQFLSANSVAVVMDTAERLDELKNINIIENDDVTHITERILEGMSSKTIKKPVYKKNDIIEKLMSKKRTGFLHIYNTALYAISTKPIREAVRTHIFEYLLDPKKSIETLTTQIETIMPKRGKGRAACVTLLQTVNSEQGSLLKQVITLAYKNPKDIDKLTKKYKISSFDVRYFLAAKHKEKL